MTLSFQDLDLEAKIFSFAFITYKMPETDFPLFSFYFMFY
jgi:hypothetical protein